jgi:hypothetical protein
LDYGVGHPSGLGVRYKYHRAEDSLVFTESCQICTLFIYLFAII